jgi:hypothetical protein
MVRKKELKELKTPYSSPSRNGPHSGTKNSDAIMDCPSPFASATAVSDA